QRYTVSARVLAAESGEELLSLIETASGEDELIGAVERLSLRLRERIGESLVSVRRSPPLSYVRTASLEALKSYTAGTEANGRGGGGLAVREGLRATCGMQREHAPQLCAADRGSFARLPDARPHDGARTPALHGRVPPVRDR